MQILDGKKTLQNTKQEILQKGRTIANKRGKKPSLSIILVGEDGASKTYVNHKLKTCEEVEFESSLTHFNEDVAEETLLEKVKEKNEDPDVDGIIVQLPLPAHISETKVIETIEPDKDVDGFHPMSAGRMIKGLPTYLPATPQGILRLLEEYDVPTKGKHCVVIGRSQIVGLPLSIMMGQNKYPGNATVTLCHSRTQNTEELIRQADIIVTAIGSPGFIKEDMVKEGAVVIDVGITRIEDPSKKKGYRLQGDVDYENVAKKCSYITPVPGGVGPMTIASLLLNTLKAAKSKIENS